MNNLTNMFTWQILNMELVSPTNIPRRVWWYQDNVLQNEPTAFNAAMQRQQRALNTLIPTQFMYDRHVNKMISIGEWYRMARQFDEDENIDYTEIDIF